MVGAENAGFKVQGIVDIIAPRSFLMAAPGKRANVAD
jgi:hypothetical protein